VVVVVVERAYRGVGMGRERGGGGGATHGSLDVSRSMLVVISLKSFSIPYLRRAYGRRFGLALQLPRLIVQETSLPSGSCHF
jgi:hypothetical protein